MIILAATTIPPAYIFEGCLLIGQQGMLVSEIKCISNSVNTGTNTACSPINKQPKMQAEDMVVANKKVALQYHVLKEAIVQLVEKITKITLVTVMAVMALTKFTKPLGSSYEEMSRSVAESTFGK